MNSAAFWVHHVAGLPESYRGDAESVKLVQRNAAGCLRVSLKFSFFFFPHEWGTKGVNNVDGGFSIRFNPPYIWLSAFAGNDRVGNPRELPGKRKSPLAVAYFPKELPPQYRRR